MAVRLLIINLNFVREQKELFYLVLKFKPTLSSSDSMSMG